MTATTYSIASYASGTGGLTAMTTVLTTIQAPPNPATFLPYADIPAEDGAGNPIESGLPRVTWEWDFLPLADWTILNTYCTGASAQVYIATKNFGGTLKEYLATMKRPRADAPALGLVKNVRVEFVNLVEQ